MQSSYITLQAHITEWGVKLYSLTHRRISGDMIMVYGHFGC